MALKQDQGGSSQGKQLTSEQQNMLARQLVLNSSQEFRQQIFQANVNPLNNILNIPIKNVGLVKYFRVVVEGTITNTSSTALSLTRTGLGAYNAVSSFQFTDFTNNQRINTTGWHIALLNSAKMPTVFGAAYSPNVPAGWGNNYNIMSGPSTLAQNADGAIKMYYDVPMAYSDNNLTGAVYAGVVNQAAYLQVTLNASPVVIGATADGLTGIYTGGAGAAGNWKAGTTIKVTVYQIYLDQLPKDKNGAVILPMEDISQYYDLKYTTLSGFGANVDVPYSYAALKKFLSTFTIFDNAGVFNAGTDVNYWMLQAANTTQMWRLDPYTASLYARSVFMSDLPSGIYYFDSRLKPIDTVTWGNMELILNASSVTAGATLSVAVEAFTKFTNLIASGSLPAGG